MTAPTLALLRTRLPIGSAFGAIGNFRGQDELTPRFSGKEFQEFVVIAGHASNGGMGFVVILRLVNNADTMPAFGAGGSNSVNLTDGKPALWCDAQSASPDRSDGRRDLIAFRACEILKPSCREVRLVISEFKGNPKDADGVVIFIFAQLTEWDVAYNVVLRQQLFVLHRQTSVVAYKERARP